MYLSIQRGPNRRAGSLIRGLLVAAVVSALSACGGGSAPSSTQTLPLIAKSAITPTDLRVIGNSLTMHPPRPDIGWAGNWGMAASTQAKDFAHVAAAKLVIPVVASNFSGLETDSATYIPHIPEVTGSITASTVVVVQLGDNVQPQIIPAFDPAYGKLLDAVAARGQLICLSSWWEYAARDAVIKKQCEAHGGHYLYIGDIYRMAGNPDRLEKQWSASPVIDAHPHDWGMNKIAERIAAAVK